MTRVLVEGLGWRALGGIELLGRTPLLRIVGVADVDAAAGLRGREVWADPAEMQLEPGVYYYSDLVGRPVVSPRGENLGAVVDVVDSGPQDVLVVERAGREFLVPFQADYVRVLEDAIEVDPIPGLLDDET